MMHETVLRKTLIIHQGKLEQLQALFTSNVTASKEEYYKHDVLFYDNTTASVSVYSKNNRVEVCVKWIDSNQHLLHTDYSTHPLGTQIFKFSTPLFAYELLIQGR